MSKLKERIDNKQTTIFEYLQHISKPKSITEGKFRIIDQLRASLRSAIKESALSRHEIAGQMSHLLGETVKKQALDSWTRQSDEINGRPRRHIPAEYLGAFCHVTGRNEPLVILGKIAGLFVLPGPEALRAEIQRLGEMEKDIKSKKRKRKLFLRALTIEEL